jgi:hypothetical protein
MKIEKKIKNLGEKKVKREYKGRIITSDIRLSLTQKKNLKKNKNTDH